MVVEVVVVAVVVVVVVGGGVVVVVVVVSGVVVCVVVVPVLPGSWHHFVGSREVPTNGFEEERGESWHQPV